MLRSPLRRLHHVLELHKAVVCSHCILGVHLREEEVRDRGIPYKLGHLVVDVHHCAGGHGGDGLPKASVDGLEVSLREHALRVHALDGK